MFVFRAESNAQCLINALIVLVDFMFSTTRLA
jgi:hypothetical protein